MRNTTGFTLIELLVVITIIVLLLALLAPALDKAVYQAQLAVCGSRLKLIGTTTAVYAFDNRRHYPYLPGQRTPGSDWQVIVVRQVTQAATNDNLTVLKSYLQVNKTLNDPLNEDLDFEGSEIDSFVYSDYSLWFSWVYRERGQSGMYRLGDRFTYTNPFTTVTHSFDVLASDVDRVAPANVTLNTHPDDAGVLGPIAWQDRAFVGVGNVGALKQTLSCWASSATAETGIYKRGQTDMNTAFADGSVRRYDRVKYDEGDRDGRVTKVPEGQGQGSQDGINGWWNHLPAD